MTFELASMEVSLLRPLIGYNSGANKLKMFDSLMVQKQILSPWAKIFQIPSENRHNISNDKQKCPQM